LDGFELVLVGEEPGGGLWLPGDPVGGEASVDSVHELFGGGLGAVAGVGVAAAGLVDLGQSAPGVGVGQLAERGGRGVRRRGDR
jgi:hypothetical protein